MKKYLFLLMLVLCLVLVGCGEVTPKKSTPSDGLLTNELTTKEMKQDLNFYVEFIKKNHVDFDHTITEEEFDSEIDKIKNNLENMTSDEFVFELMKLSSKIGDANTYTLLDNERLINRQYLPFEAKLFVEGYIITSIEETNKDYLGYELIALEGVSIEEVITKLSAYSSGDTLEAKKYYALENLNFYDMLYNAGLVSSKYVQLTLTNGEEEVKVSVEAYKNSDYSKVKFATDEISLYTTEKEDNYSYSLEDRLVYIQYNYCYNSSKQSMTEFVEKVKPNLSINIHKNVVLDLRYNIGGNQDTIFPLISALNDFKKAGGNVYVLIGKGTRGVALINAMYLYNNDIATIIGEETGGLTNFYGVRDVFKLPNSLLTLTCATKYQEFYKNQNGITLKPTHVVSQSYADYIEGNDSLIKYILK